MREYNQRPEVKARKKVRMKKYMREYNQRPEVKAREKKRKRKYKFKELTETEKAKRRKYMREYSKNPQEQARRKQYNRTPKVKAIHEKYRKTTRAITKRRERRRAPKAVAKREKLKVEVFSHYSKKISSSDIPCCACCGENTSIKFLTVDHIDGRKTMDHIKSLSGIKLCHWLLKNNFPDGIQILCWNCNSTKGLYGKCPHQKLN